MSCKGLKVFYGRVKPIVPLFGLTIIVGVYLFCGGAGFRKIETLDQTIQHENSNLSLSESVFFCFVTLTTIGYGNLSPKTKMGKVFTMVYSIIGIPLFLILLSSVGKVITFAYHSLLQFCWWKSRVKKQALFQCCCTQIPTWVIVSFFAICLLLGVLMTRFCHLHWSIFDSVYFIVISMTTIGYGDITPGNGDMYLTVPYMILALSVTGMLIQKLVDLFNKFAGRLAGLNKVGEDTEVRKCDVSKVPIVSHCGGQVRLESVLRAFVNSLKFSDFAGVEVSIEKIESLIEQAAKLETDDKD